MVESKKTFKNINYLEFRPATIEGILLFNHGWGQRGSDLQLLKQLPIPKLYAKGLLKNYLTICPQMPKTETKTMFSSTELGYILDLITSIRTTEVIKKAHVTGLSLGGFHSLGLLKKAYQKYGVNNFFTSAGIVCGRTTITEATLPAFTGIPIKWWHGTHDDTNKITNPRGFTKKVNAAGGNVTLVEWDAGHGVWDRAYTEEEFWAFLQTC